MTTPRKRTLIAPAVLAATLAAGLTVRAQQGGVAERVGNALDNTGRAIKSGVQGAFARSRARVQTMEMVDRVYSRLHWERALATSTLELEVDPGGVTVLRGVVPDARAKAKAVELARNTVGVTQVVDELSVVPPTGAPLAAPVVEPRRNN